jgi:hypothetical protein
MAERFMIGDVYFRVKYDDSPRRFPLCESLVFIGKNLSDEDSEDMWYFQFADSCAKHGSILETTGGDRRVVCLTAGELADMLDDQGLIAELGAARRRRSTSP